MNRFRNRRKGNDTPEPQDNTNSSLTSSKTFKRNKKKPQHVEPEIDLKTVLPSADDFRTSLLMPNLSARFSMLREQDDPNSKLGKANDDSVLFPKRASRLNLFSNNALADIDEVASLKESIRPPFATTERSDSFASDGGYGTDDDTNNGGSIMSRSKPGQGNNLFGGRQKLYAIPAGGATNKGLGGRVIYEDDVTQSAFQKLKQKEKEESRSSEESEMPAEAGLISEENESASSPSTTAFSRNRGTVSSTNSAPSNKRTSTAATSIESQPTNGSQLSKNNSQSQPNLDRQATIHRRLYGQALEQSPSAREVLESITRQRAVSTDKSFHPLLQSKSATGMNEKFQRSAPVYSSTTVFRSASPPPSVSPPPTVPSDLGTRSFESAETSAEKSFGFVPPLSPPISDSESMAAFSSSVQPEDRGKATAMGLFNKPTKQYDDQQFSQRQMQMHVDSQRNFSTRTPPPTTPLPSIPTKPASRASSNASSAGSHQSFRPRESPMPVSIKREPSLPTVSGSPPDPQKTTGTFFDAFSPSDDSDTDQPSSSLSRHHPTVDAFGVHPAFRPQHSAARSPSVESGVLPLDPATSFILDFKTEKEASDTPPDGDPLAIDSPTLGPVGGIGGLIRTHLRQDSEASVLPPSPGFQPEAPEYLHSTFAAATGRTVNHPESMHSNPFEYDDMASKQADQPEHAAQDPVMTMSEKARQILGQAAALRAQNQGKPQQVLISAASRSSEDQAPSRTWQEELQLHHQRHESTSTERDREEFNNELAERRRRVRENLKSVVEGSSRATSPAPSASAEQHRQSKASNAFSMLRSKTSKHPMPDKNADSNSKAMKMLGIGTSSTQSESNKVQKVDLWHEEEEQMLQALSQRPKPRAPRSPLPPQTSPSPPRPSVDSASRGFPGFNQSHGDNTPPFGNSRNNERFEYNHFEGQNLRSGVGHSKEGNSTHEHDRPSQPPTSTSMSARPSVESNRHYPYERSASAATGRYRSESRAASTRAATNYFDSHALQPIQTGSPDLGASPRPSPSPSAPYSANSTPPLYIDHPSPAMTEGDAQHPSGRSTPQLPLQQPPRKRSVTKGMISEPTFLSSTSTIPTYGLPRSQNGPDHRGVTPPGDNPSASPPLPAMNPRRRRPTTTLQTNSGRRTPVEHQQMPRSANASIMPVPPLNDYAFTPDSATSGRDGRDAAEERSESYDDNDKQKHPRQRLRKSSSEGGSLNSLARAERLKEERSPGLPMQGSSPHPYYPPSVRGQGPGPGPGPGTRSRTPTTSGRPPALQHTQRMTTMPVGPVAHAGKPMGWQGPAPPKQMGYGLVGPESLPMPSGRPPMRPTNPPGMPASGRQQERMVDGGMF